MSISSEFTTSTNLLWKLSVTFSMLLLLLFPGCHGGKGMLHPQDSESRESKLLDGIWKFRADFSPTRVKGFDQQWWLKPLDKTGPVIDMPVPSSFNDVTEDKSLRDFVGWVWYETSFFLSPGWKDRRVVLRFDSAHYNSIVWVNGVQLMEHSGGHLPFEGRVNDLVDFLHSNRLTVALNNTLTPHTLPPGNIVYEDDRQKYPEGYFVQELQMDFFNYGGLHRHVRLYTTPWEYVDDITVVTDTVDGNGIGWVGYDITVAGASQATNISIEVIDASGTVVARKSDVVSGTMKINNATYWWPYGMNQTVGYLYTFKVNASGDVYRLPIGIRTVQVKDTAILINGNKFYCHGVDKHEDSDLRGKGLDSVVITKDFNMLRWLGVNCFRTSHYPYASEIMHMADRQGIAIIDESPGVGIKFPRNMHKKSLLHHLAVMGEMVRRDKNHPSVIMWSVANEPGSQYQEAVPYFKSVIQHTKDLDPAKRPVTFVSSHKFEIDLVVPYVDVICINRYYGWYHDPGHLEVIGLQLRREFEGFHKLYNKPIMMTEYGADTVPGLHRTPSMMFTEDYQSEFLSEYHKVFDELRSRFLVGELVWNFADFMTIQGVKRVVGNKKGLLTRQRQPKAAAYVIRNRYHALLTGQDPKMFYHNAFKYSNNPHSYSTQL